MVVKFYLTLITTGMREGSVFIAVCLLTVLVLAREGTRTEKGRRGYPVPDLAGGGGGWPGPGSGRRSLVSLADREKHYCQYRTFPLYYARGGKNQIFRINSYVITLKVLLTFTPGHICSNTVNLKKQIELSVSKL